MSRVPTIGIVDSGVGGLTIYSAVRAAVPTARYHYCSDNAHFPYGTRREDDVIQCVTAMVDGLHRHQPLDLLVVACNTASTVVLPALREKFAFPVVGVVPAIKPAAALTRTGTIGILATPKTVSGPYTDGLIAAHAANVRVIKIGSPLLAPWAENKLRGEQIDLGALRAELEPFFARAEPASERVDVVVLGCTHFPLLVEEMTKVSPWPLAWLDSAGAIARRVQELLPASDEPRRSIRATMWFTLGGKDPELLAPALARYHFDEVKILATEGRL